MKVEKKHILFGLGALLAGCFVFGRKKESIGDLDSLIQSGWKRMPYLRELKKQFKNGDVLSFNNGEIVCVSNDGQTQKWQISDRVREKAGLSSSTISEYNDFKQAIKALRRLDKAVYLQSSLGNVKQTIENTKDNGDKVTKVLAEDGTVLDRQNSFSQPVRLNRNKAQDKEEKPYRPYAYKQSKKLFSHPLFKLYKRIVEYTADRRVAALKAQRGRELSKEESLKPWMIESRVGRAIYHIAFPDIATKAEKRGHEYCHLLGFHLTPKERYQVLEYFQDKKKIDELWSVAKKTDGENSDKILRDVIENKLEFIL